MGDLKRIAPIFAIRDLNRAMAHYDQLGFATRAYAGGGYGFATRDGIEIHLGVIPAEDRRLDPTGTHLSTRGPTIRCRPVGRSPPRPKRRHQRTVMD
jgi:hypothetical protein